MPLLEEASDFGAFDVSFSCSFLYIFSLMWHLPFLTAPLGSESPRLFVGPFSCLGSLSCVSMNRNGAWWTRQL